MPLPSLQPDRLTLFVFGPGTGELIAVHAPPGVWMFVDGCSARSRGYAAQLLENYGGEVALIVFTHPHVDHARGLAELVDATTQGDPITWPMLGMVPPAVATGAGDTSDPVAHHAGGVAEQAVSAIVDRWERHESCRWELLPGTSRPVGQAQVTALSPEVTVRTEASQARAAGGAFDWNRLSSALCVEWEGHRIVLGSDLVEKPGNGWTTVLDSRPDLPNHTGLKIAHHGSKDAQHRPLLARPKAAKGRPVWVATPFASKNLPRFSNGEGLHELLKHVREVHLTALPARYDNQGARRANG